MKSKISFMNVKKIMIFSVSFVLGYFIFFNDISNIKELYAKLNNLEFICAKELQVKKSLIFYTENAQKYNLSPLKYCIAFKQKMLSDLNSLMWKRFIILFAFSLICVFLSSHLTKSNKK